MWVPHQIFLKLILRPQIKNNKKNFSWLHHGNQTSTSTIGFKRKWSVFITEKKNPMILKAENRLITAFWVWPDPARWMFHFHGVCRSFFKFCYYLIPFFLAFPLSLILKIYLSRFKIISIVRDALGLLFIYLFIL